MLLSSAIALHNATSHDNSEVYVWQLVDGQQIATFKAIAAWVKSLALSPDGETLAIGNHDRIVKLLPIPSQTVRRELYGHASSVLSVAVSAEKRFLASSGEDTTIKIWDTQIGDRPLEGMNILGVTGLTDAQTETLRVLSASEC